MSLALFNSTSPSEDKIGSGGEAVRHQRNRNEWRRPVTFLPNEIIELLTLAGKMWRNNLLGISNRPQVYPIMDWFA
jgi:hypothetical protein